MYILIFFIISLFIFVTAVVVSGFNSKQKDKIFKLSNNNEGKFSCVQSLAKMIEKKLNNQVEISSFLPKERFFSLGLIYAPIYVINAKNVGCTHLKLYQKAFELIRQKVNCVIIDSEIKVDNPNINVVSLKSDKIGLIDISILNKLNINRNGLKQYIPNYEKYVMLDKNEKISASFCYDYGIIKAEDKTNFNFYLPKDAFGYVFKGKRNKIAIFSIFGERIIELVGSFSAEASGNKINLSVNKSNNIMVRFNSIGKEKEVLNLLNFDIKHNDFSEDIEKLKVRAIEELNKNFFLIFKTLKSFEIKNLTDFFKVVNLRQNYYNDYILLVKKIFGLSIKNSVLNANPMPIVQQDFSVSYMLNGENYEVKYSMVEDGGVKLSRVGHKLGMKENFVYNF